MLKKIAKRINKELEQAYDYCYQSMLVKHEHFSVADLFVQLSKEKVMHAKKLLKEGQRLVDDKNEHDEKCVAIWEWETRLATERISEIEYKLSMYSIL